MNKLYLNHPETGKPDPTLTFAVIGFAIVVIKYLLNNTTFQGINFGNSDAASILAFMSPIFAHVWDQKNKNNKDGEDK